MQEQIAQIPQVSNQKISGVYAASGSVRQQLFSDYVRSATRRQMFVQMLGSADHEVVRTEQKLMLRAKERLQCHLRELGDRLSPHLRDDLLRHMFIQEIAGYDDLDVDDRAAVLVALLQQEGLSVSF